ncbi:hypothetical protein CL618_02415 [archaeon]|nr:hypothetical protein [archaeon]
MKKEKEDKNVVVQSAHTRLAGIFDLDEVLQAGSGKCWEMGYFWSETEHTEKQKSSGEELTIEWNCWKKVDNYYRFYINVIFNILRYNKVIVEKDGEKKEMGRGEIEITVKSVLEKDYNHMFDKSPIGKFIRVLYELMVLKDRTSRMEGNLLKETYELNEVLKESIGQMIRENRKYY